MKHRILHKHLDVEFPRVNPRPTNVLIYVNDTCMCNISDEVKYILFADDTSVFMSHPDVQVLQQNSNRNYPKKN